MTEYKHMKLWTRPSNYGGAEWYDYYSSGVGQSRDSDALERSNFASMLKQLGGESDTVLVVHEGHWAVGWVEWIAIHKDDHKALVIADGVREALQDYPVIDEDHFSQTEEEEAQEVWTHCYNENERIRFMRKHTIDHHFESFGDLRDVVRGKYFPGYASDLLS